MRQRCSRVAFFSLAFSFFTAGLVLAQSPGFWVESVGDRRKLLAGNIDSVLQISTLRDTSGLYGLGPMAGLQGEITIYGGKACLGQVGSEGEPRSREGWEVGASFPVYGAAKNWKEVVVDRQLDGVGQVEKFVEEQMVRSGLSIEQATPFRIEGPVDELRYHILHGTGSVIHDPEEHQKAKRKFRLANRELKVVGFWASAQGVGVYTPSTSRTHLHFVDLENTVSGHVDDLKLAPGAVLFLPEP